MVADRIHRRVAAMLAPGLFVWANFINVPADAAAFEVVGQQWHWRYRFPGKDGKLGIVDARYISNENPFGLNPDDPNGQDDVLVSSPDAFARQQTGQGAASLYRRSAQLHGAAVSPRWILYRAWSPISG